MSKRIIVLSLIIGTLTWSTIALAQESPKTATNSTTGSAAIDEKKIQALKEKLATKVAELRQNQTRGFYGEIAALSKTSFTLVTKSGEIKVRYGDDAVLYKIAGKRTDAKSADLKNTLTTSVLGVYDPDAKTVTAKVILLESNPKYYAGDISAVDKTGAVIKIKTDKGDTLNIDYEKTTVANEYDVSSGKTAKSGLSRMSVGDRMHLWGEVSDSDAQRVSATRLFRIPKSALGAKTIESTLPSPNTISTPATSPKTTAPPKFSPNASPKTSAES